MSAHRRFKASMRALALCALALPTGCGSDADRQAGTARTGVPPGAVATVAGEPIGRAELVRSLAALRRVAGGRRTPDELERMAVEAVLRRAWLEGEAARRGIEVARADVHARWNAMAARFAPDEGLRRALGWKSEADAFDQIRLQLVVAKIHDRIRRRVGDERARRAIDSFHDELPARWRQRTSCAARYAAASGCGPARP